MNEMHVTVSGRLVADPEARETKGGVPFAAFRLATSSRRFNPGNNRWEESAASYLNVTAFRALGTNVAESLEKGHPVVVHGRMRVAQFTRGDGNPGTSVELDAYAIGHDLTFGTATFTKVSRATVDPRDRLADANVQDAFHGAGGVTGEGDAPPERDPDRDPYEMDDGSDTGRTDFEGTGDQVDDEDTLETSKEPVPVMA